MADSRNRGEENMSVTDDEERSQTTSSVASTDVGKYLITHSDYTAFVAKFVRHFLSFHSDDIYRSFVRFSLNQNVESVSRSKLISDATNVVGEVKLKLIENFANLSNKVSVSADIVSDYWRRFNFISITCRWFDEKWYLQKRLIAFRQFDVEHSSSNISNMIHTVLQEYNLVEKTGSISFDHFIGDETSLDALSQCCQSSVDGCKFFHIKCINHVLSLCAQECLASLKEHISPIRAAISRLTRSMSLTNKWAIFCKDHDLEPPKKILLDKPNRWNSTYKMLNDSFEYRETLCSFFEQQQCGIVLFPSQWDHCTDLCELLKVFKDIIVELSGVYFLNSWLVVDNCVKIALALEYFSSCAYLGDCIARMKENWLKYFLHIPDVFLIAKVLDPRVRVDGLEELLTMYYDSLFPIRNDDTPKPNEIASNTKQLLFSIFEKYMKNIGVSKDTTSSGDVSNTVLDMLNDLYRRPWKRRRDDSNPYAEVDDYLTACFDYAAYEVPLDVLNWWSNKGELFSIMSLIAKEIFACPALTLSVEQAFSVEDCTLDARRSTLTVEDVENRCLLEDWVCGEARIQDANLDADDESDADDVNVMRL